MITEESSIPGPGEADRPEQSAPQPFSAPTRRRAERGLCAFSAD